MAKKGYVTAEELMRRLEADPEWRARRAARDARHARTAALDKADAAALLEELAGAGAIVSSIYDFVNAPPAPAAALPILVKHLEMKHRLHVREGIIRALSISTARSVAFDALKRAFMSEIDPCVQWVIANALSAMSSVDEVKDLPDMKHFKQLFG